MGFNQTPASCCRVCCQWPSMFWTLQVLEGNTAAQSHNNPTHRCHATYQHLCQAAAEVGGSKRGGWKEGNVNVHDAKKNVKHFHSVHCLTMVLMTKPKNEKSNTAYCEHLYDIVELSTLRPSPSFHARKKKNATCVISKRPTCCALTQFLMPHNTTQHNHTKSLTETA